MKTMRIGFAVIFNVVFLLACSNDSETETPKPATASTTQATTEIPVAVTKGASKKDVVALGLRGKIQSFTESVYKTTAQGAKGNLSNRKVFKFNEDGDRVEVLSYNSQGAIVSTTKFTYGENKHITTEEVILANGKVGSRFVCKTDSAGRKIEQKDVAMSKNPLTNLTYKFEYDEKGNIKRWLSVTAGNSPMWNYFYTYDNNDNRVEWAVKSLNGSLIRKNIYRYDNKNHMIEEQELDAAGALKNKYTYEYQLDKNNNWIRQVKEENNKPIEIRERTYEYYN